MYEFGIPRRMLQCAQRMGDELGELSDSIRRGEGNVYGFLGELVFSKITGGDQNNTYEWDVVMSDGHTVDVKSKCVTTEPRPHYECSVAARGTHQNCDYYAFVRGLKDCTMAWYLGAMGKQEFLRRATFMEAGVWKDPANGWSPTIDCYNIEISDLYLDKEDPASLPPLT